MLQHCYDFWKVKLRRQEFQNKGKTWEDREEIFEQRHTSDVTFSLEY